MIKTIYFAGGCFWGTERLFQIVPGVVETEVGYANGHTEHPTYEEVCTDTTGHRETVKVVYDNDAVSLETLLDVFFLCIDPTVQNRQANDIGSQYQTGIYYEDMEDATIIEEACQKETKKHVVFYVEQKPLEIYYPAEEYHQDYLLKNPTGYCHITSHELEAVKEYLKKKTEESYES